MEEFLLDVGVGARDIGFRLVVVVIRDEILDRVVGKERLELAVELCGQSFVRRKDEGRALRRLDHLGHGEGFSRAGDAEQHLRAVASLHALDQVLDGLRLVAFRLEVGRNDEAFAAFGFFRARGPVRRPGLGAEFRPALAQQPFERLLAGDAAKAARLRRQVGAGEAIFRIATGVRPDPAGAGGRGRHGRRVVGQSQFLRQFRVEAGHRRGRVVALWRLVEFPGCGLARLVRLGKIPAAVP